MLSDSDEMFAQIREAAQNLAKDGGQRLLIEWQDLHTNPMISCIALIRMAYTLSPDSVTGATDGPEQFAEFCRLVVRKEGILN